MKGRIKIGGDFHNLLIVFPAAIILLFAFFAMFPIVAETTHAEGDEPDDGITVVASSDISVNLLSMDDGYYKIFKDAITVSTSSENGYTLSVATDSADHQTLYLNGDTSSENRINGTTGTYEDPKALGDYEWGFAVSGIGHFDDEYSTESPSAESKFAILPLENKVIRDYTEAATDNTTNIYYGFKLSGTLEPGEYESAITYTAVPADQPLTAKAILGNNGNLNFVYNRNTYTTGETYTDNIGETEISEVYDVPTNAYVFDDGDYPSFEYCPAWTDWEVAKTIYSANLDSSFYNFKPTSTSCWFKNSHLATITNLENLNTKTVTDMSYMFSFVDGYDVTDVDLDLSGLDTSHATNMSHMFESAGEESSTFSLNLSGWDTGNVTDMSSVFMYAGYYAEAWSIDGLNDWNVGNVTTTSHMFCEAGNYASASTVSNLDLSGWITNNVTDMSEMFSYTGFSVGDLSGWNTSKVTNMSYMFTSSPSTQNIGDLSGWDTSNVTNMSSMFSGAGWDDASWDINDLNIGGWKTGNVTNMSHMFSYAGNSIATFSLDLSGWDTSNVTTMAGMFDSAGYNAVTFNLNLSGWNTSKVTDMSYMFRQAEAGNSDATEFRVNFTDWDTSSVTNMSYMFYDAGRYPSWQDWQLEGARNWDVSNVTNHKKFVNDSRPSVNYNCLPRFGS